MNRIVCLTLLISLAVLSVFGQKNRPLNKPKPLNERTDFIFNDTATVNNAGTKKINLSAKTKYTDYKIFSFFQDTAYVDTSLTIQKHHAFNFLRKDLFGLVPLHNIGQTFNRLTYDFYPMGPSPDIGFSAKQFFFKKIKDLHYYEVPTQTSEIMFLTTLEQGQFLDSFFTVNFSRRMNVSIAYTGLRSLGKYRESLASQGNFRTTFHYENKKRTYQIRGHLTTHDLLNEESGGLTDEALQAFIDNDPNFSDRARLDVNLDDTESFFKSSRLFFEHDFKILSSKDSIDQKDVNILKIGHALTSETKSYEFRQNSVTDLIGSSNVSGPINDGVKNSFLKNTFFLEFNSKHLLGTLRLKSNLMRYAYGYEEMKSQNSEITNLKLQGNATSLGAEWNAKANRFKMAANGEITPGSNEFSGTNLYGNVSYRKDSSFEIKASVLLNSKSPNFNFLLHQSSYDAYNWENNFDNTKTQDIGLHLDSKWLNVGVNVTNIKNYTYFGEDSQPKQYLENILYFKVKTSAEYRYGKLALDNTVMYQNVRKGAVVFRVPELVTRNTFYYDDYWFEGKPMKVQIGATFNHFTKFNANAYNPLLAEFVLQNSEEIGFSTIDLFFNAQIKRTRIYFKIDNALSDFSKRNYFSAPGYPYRDATIRFGLVWNWFI